jgi:hypothetical protein
MNFGPKQSYRTATAGKSEVSHAQTNYGGRTTKKGGTNKSKVQVQGEKAGFGTKQPKSHFGEKTGTGSQGGY